MRSQTRIIVTVTFLTLSAAILVSCEDSGVTAPTDGQILVSANPGTIVIDRQLGEEDGQSTITAQVFDSGGFALEDVLVTFSASGGSLASSDNGCSEGKCLISGDVCTVDTECLAVPPTPIETDANGLALDVLTLELADPVSVEVTVRSSTLSQSVQVTKTISSGNVQPIAQAQAFPANQVDLDNIASLSFSGTGSVDPDGDDITCYKWTIGSFFSQGPSNSLIDSSDLPAYDREQSLTVVLRVSDDPTVPCSPSPEAPDSFFSPDVAQINYTICDNERPTADAGDPQTTTVGVSVSLDGTGSSDPENNIDTYSWTCGNGSSAAGATANCVYNTAGSFTATLTVRDAGNPLSTCSESATDSVLITVNP